MSAELFLPASEKHILDLLSIWFHLEVFQKLAVKLGGRIQLLMFAPFTTVIVLIENMLNNNRKRFVVASASPLF